jgi:hypothetical protein
MLSRKLNPLSLSGRGPTQSRAISSKGCLGSGKVVGAAGA